MRLRRRRFLSRAFSSASLEDHLFHRGLVEAGEHVALEPSAAAAGILARGVRPPAHAQPDRALIHGIAQRVRPGQVAQHVQPPPGGQQIGRVLGYAVGGVPPDGAVLKPHLLHRKIHPGGLDAVFDFQRHFKGAAALAFQPLHAFHLAGQHHALRVEAGEHGLHAGHRLFGQVEQLQAAQRILLRRQRVVPQFHRASQVNLHGSKSSRSDWDQSAISLYTQVMTHSASSTKSRSSATVRFSRLTVYSTVRPSSAALIRP